MATQTVTLQPEQATAEIQRAVIAEVEAAGKTMADLLAQMKATHQPFYLNYESGESLVVLDINDYQRLVESVGFLEAEITSDTSVTALSETELAESRAAVQRGLEDVAAGRTRPIEEFFEELEKKHPFLAGVAETI
jgi:predicted xylose isomerase-like sugar epimerase